MRSATWFPHGIGPRDEYDRRVEKVKVRPAGGRFHPSQLSGLRLSDPAEVAMFGPYPIVVRILPGDRKVTAIEIHEARMMDEFALAVERKTFGDFELPPLPAAVA